MPFQLNVPGQPTSSQTGAILWSQQPPAHAPNVIFSWKTDAYHRLAHEWWHPRASSLLKSLYFHERLMLIIMGVHRHTNPRTSGLSVILHAPFKLSLTSGDSYRLKLNTSTVFEFYLCYRMYDLLDVWRHALVCLAKAWLWKLLESATPPDTRNSQIPDALATIECQMGRSRGLGHKLHGKGLNRRLTKGASTSHFFSFTTAIDQGMTSVNQPQCLNLGIENNHDVLISAPTSQNPTVTFRNQRQHLEINSNVSNPVPTSQNQPAAMSQNPPMGTLEPWPSILTIYYLACLKNYIGKYSIILFFTETFTFSGYVRGERIADTSYTPLTSWPN